VLDLSVQQFLIRIVDSLIIVAIHGYALGGTARLMGDRGPQLDGRLTLNPFTQLDIVGIVALILTQLGWIRPMTIDPKALRFGRLGLVLCVVVSLVVTLALAFALLALRLPVLASFPSTVAPSIIAGLNEVVEMAAWFVALNLLPIPPLTGAQLLVAVRPGLVARLPSFQPYAGLAVGALILAGVGRIAVKPLHDAIAAVLSSR
jgi:Zn-dependent protease